MSTPEQFYESLRSGDLASGFLNRFLTVHAKDENGRPNNCRFTDPPQTVIDGIRTILLSRDGNIGEAMGVYTLVGGVGEERMEWAADGVAEAAERLEIDIHNICKDHPRGDMLAGPMSTPSASLLRSFVCQCHTISAMPRFQPPPRR